MSVASPSQAIGFKSHWVLGTVEVLDVDFLKNKGWNTRVLLLAYRFGENNLEILLSFGKGCLGNSGGLNRYEMVNLDGVFIDNTFGGWRITLEI